MAQIHPTALVDPAASLHETVEVGPYCIVGPQVSLDRDCRLHAFAQVLGRTQMGPENVVHSHAVVGNIPQDKKYRGEDTALVIGARNTIRECCTINLGTIQDGGVTRIGNDNWIMAYVHIAHDCQVGSHIIMANSVQLAGHVSVGDWAILGGITGVHQFVRIGAHAMTGAGTTLIQDLPPYVMSTGNPASAHGINGEGLRRRGFSEAALAVLRKAYKTVYKSGLSLADAIAEVQQLSRDASTDAQEALAPLLDFLTAPGRGIVR